MPNDSTLKGFADDMGAAAKQLADGLLQLLKEYLQKQQETKQAQQAGITDMLKDAGYETSPENMQMLEQYLDNAREAQKLDGELLGVQAEMDKLGGKDPKKLAKLQEQQKGLSARREKLGNVNELPDLKIDERRLEMQIKAEAAKERVGHRMGYKKEGGAWLKPDGTHAAKMGQSIKPAGPALARQP